MQQVGEAATFVGGSVNPENVTFAGGDFIASLANFSEGAIASFATGTVNQSIDGYTLQCFDEIGGTAVGDTKISIPGKLQLEQIICCRLIAILIRAEMSYICCFPAIYIAQVIYSDY